MNLGTVPSLLRSFSGRMHQGRARPQCAQVVTGLVKGLKEIHSDFRRESKVYCLRVRCRYTALVYYLG